MIPFIDLKSQYREIESQVRGRIDDVLGHGQFVMGPEVSELERELEKFVGVKHAIGCSSGTDALLLCLMALDLKRGDEVIVPDFSFFATSEVVSLLGLRPVFVDVNPDTYNIDIQSVKNAITPKTKAIIPVSLYGQCADFDELNEIEKERGIVIIEDGAQSFGATYKKKRSCGLTTMAATSFFPSKPLGAYGDGGAVFCNDDKLAQKMRELLVHGQSGRYIHTSIGINGRLDTIQAAILIEKLKIFPDEIKKRQEIAEVYNKKLNGKIKTTKILDYNTSVWAQYTIEVESRDEFQKKMKDKGVPTAVHYPNCLSDQPVYSNLEKPNNPNAQRASERVVSLPFHPYLKKEQQEKILSALLS